MRSIPELQALPDEVRRGILAQLSEAERVTIGRQADTENPWAIYANDPVAFVTDGLQESVWSKQIEILESLRDHKRTAVPAGHSVGKSHLAARAIAWWVCAHPSDRVRVVTTATTFRQVRAVLWPHIRRLHTAHRLPGEVMMTEWKIDDIPVADGFSPADHNEAAVQGIHAEHLLVVVDEAGGISQTIGQALEALMTGGHTRLLLLGNPPTNEMNTWFERACNSDLYNVIPISTLDTPNLTGEKTGAWARNLVDQTWVDDTIREFGEESPFVQARVYARFPRTTTNVTIPIDWVEAAQMDTSELEGVIRLGVDVAADGGDEFVIARADGMHARIIHTSTHNDNAVEVAGIVLEAILAAQEDHEARGIGERVRVKIDSIGVGWGVSSLLVEWGKEGRHAAEIVPVNVAEKAQDSAKFTNQRAEMWWAMRSLLQPDSNGQQELTLDIGRRELLQLTAPTYRSNSTGRLQIESKADMKRRGVTSPDRAEALLLAVFEPPRKGFDIAAPLSLTQSHGWI